MKEAYDKKRHVNSKYVVEEIVVMRRAPACTGESVKLQNRYRGPLVVTELLCGDVYRVVELNNNKTQLKSCNFMKEKEERKMKLVKSRSLGSDKKNGGNHPSECKTMPPQRLIANEKKRMNRLR